MTLIERLRLEDSLSMRQYEREARVTLWHLLTEAADEIERLRGDLEDILSCSPEDAKDIARASCRNNK